MNYLLRFPGGRVRALTFSYDDGVTADIPLVKIFDDYGLKGTFNINTGLFYKGDDPLPDSYNTTVSRRMTREETYNLFANSSHEVAVHSLTHPELHQCPIERATYEILIDRINIEEMFGGICRGMAYPYGNTSDTAVKAIAASGIAYARTTVSTEKFDIPTVWLRMPATCHHKNPRLMELADKFLADPKSQPTTPKLFYIWGHSYEFCHDQNWDVIIKLAEKLAHNDTIWYATNIEIYNYVRDFYRLEVSCDGKIFHNPTNTDLFVAISKGEDGTVKIPAGETVRI